MKKSLNTSLSLRKVILSALVAAPLATLPAPLWALPSTASTNFTSSSTATVVTPAGSTLSISTPDRTVLKWVEFGGTVTNTIASGDSIIYNLPSATSSVLNMVTGASPTVIGGTLSSNGRILVLNQNGITVSSTGQISAAGVTLSTRGETEFAYVANGDLGLTAPTAPTTDIQINGAITVGSSGNVLLMARNVTVAGNIDAGLLTVNAGIPGTGGGVTLGGTSDIVLGNVSAKTGNISVSTNGGTLTVTPGAGNVTVAGGNATVVTADGSVTQTGAGAFKVGKSDADGTLNLNAGAGTVTLTKTNAAATNRALVLNLTSGAASIAGNQGGTALNATTTGNLTLSNSSGENVAINASSIGGNLSVTSGGGSITSGGVVTMTSTTNNAISLSATTLTKAITYAGAGDINLTSLSSNATGNVSITAATGSISLPTIATAARLVATASGNITQTGSLTVGGDTIVDAGGAVALNNIGNDFNFVVIKNAPSGATITDKNAIVLKGGTAATGNVTLNAATTIQLGNVAADVINVAGDLNLVSNGGVLSLAITSGGTGYTSAPTFTVVGGSSAASGTTTLGINAIAAPTTAGSGYTSVPTVTLTGGGGTGAAAVGILEINGMNLPTIGTGYTVGNTITISGGGSSVSATGDVTAVDSAGQITGITFGTTGVGFTSTPTITIALGAGTALGTGANVTPTGRITGVSVTTPGSGYTSMPTATIAAPTSGTAASGGLAVTGQVATTTITNFGSGYASVAPTGVTFSSGAATATPTFTAGAAGISDVSDNVTVGGKLNLATAGVVTLNGSRNDAIGLKSSYGQVNTTVTPSSLTLFENTTVNLGNVSTTGALKVYSLTGNGAVGITNSGTITAGSVLVGAGTAAAPGDINLNFVPSTGTGNTLGTISFINDLGLLDPLSTVVGNYLVRNATIVEGDAAGVTLSVPQNTYLEGIKGTVNLTGTSIANAAAPIAVSGKLILNSTGAITVNNASNAISSVTVNSGTSSTGATADVAVSSTTAMAVDGTFIAPVDASGVPTTVRAATFTSGGNITIGAITSNFAGTTTFDASAAGSVVDSVTGIQIYGPATFLAENDVVVTRAGHSFGLVTLANDAHDKVLSISESGTLKLGNINGNNTRANITLTSTNGDVVQNAGSVIKSANTGRVVTVRASNGSVALTEANAVQGRFEVTGGGNVTITNTASGDTLLGNVTTLGALTVVGKSGNEIKQSSTSAKIFAYGDSTVTAGGSGKITLTSLGNNFGGLYLSTGSGNVSVTESGTLNVKAAATTGLLTLESQNADIIDTSVSSSIINAANATFTASKGNITLDNAGNLFASVGLNAAGNVSIVQTTGDLSFKASTIGGSLTATNQGAGFDLLQTGTLTVNGGTTLNTNSGAIILGDANNQFGALRFVVGQDSTITEGRTLNLNAGSVATGKVILNTTGDFITSGTGGSSFTNDLTINAVGTIKPSAGSMLVTGTLTVFSNATKDLSALSKSGNLAGKDPVNLGSGTYVPPSP